MSVVAAAAAVTAGAALYGATKSGPDYAGLEQQSADSQLALNRQTAMANRLTQVNPDGTLTYTQDPDNQDKWASTVTLSPDNQRLYDASMRRKLDMAGLAAGLDQNAMSMLGVPFQVKPFRNPNDKDIPAGYDNSGTVIGAASIDPRAAWLRQMRATEYATPNIGDQKYSQNDLGDLYQKAKADGATDQNVYDFAQGHGINNLQLARAVNPNIKTPEDDAAGEAWMNDYIASLGLKANPLSSYKPAPTPKPTATPEPTPEPTRWNGRYDQGGGA